VIAWDRDGTPERRVTAVRDVASGQSVFEPIYDGNGHPTSLRINGDSYPLTREVGYPRLTQIGFPDTTSWQFSQTEQTAPGGGTELPETGVPGSGVGDAWVEMTATNRNRIVKTFDNSGQLVTQMSYNNNDAVTSRKDAAGNETTYEYLNRYGQSLLTKVTTPTGLVTEYEDDARGSRTKVILPGGTEWTMTYTPQKRVDKITAPDGTETEYQYDARANVIKLIDAAGRETDFAYNEFDLADLAKSLGVDDAGLMAWRELLDMGRVEDILEQANSRIVGLSPATAQAAELRQGLGYFKENAA